MTIQLKNNDDIEEFLETDDRPDELIVCDFIYWYFFGNAQVLFQCSDKDAGKCIPLLWENMATTGDFHEDDLDCVYEPDTDRALIALSKLYDLASCNRHSKRIYLNRKPEVG